MSSLARRLTAMYLGATLVVLLILAAGVAVSEMIAFTRDIWSTIPVARQHAVATITAQRRAGRSLVEAAEYAQKHLGRPNLYLFVHAAAPNGSVREVFNGASADYKNVFRRHEAFVVFVMIELAGGQPTSSAFVTASVPGGTLYVDPNYYHLADAIEATFLRLLPFAVIAIGISYILARRIALGALRPLHDATEALHQFAAGDFASIRANANAPQEIRALNEAYNAAAAQAQKAVDDRELAADNVRAFIADASHELKTPLTIIMGYVGAISEGVVTERGDEERILTKTLAECRRMRGTIEKLISLARLDREPLNAAPFDIVTLTREVTDSMKPLARELSFNASSDRETLVLGNHDEIREALVCIIENAVKYAPGSPIDVQVTKAADVSVVEIADAGPGMSAEDREHVFERFRRGSSHGDVEGSGLGLAIAKRAVQRANGRIALSSELGRGTTVRLYLRCVAANGARDEESPKERAEQS